MEVDYGTAIPYDAQDYTLPLWATSPAAPTTFLLNLDISHHPIAAGALHAMDLTKDRMIDI